MTDLTPFDSPEQVEKWANSADAMRSYDYSLREALRRVDVNSVSKDVWWVEAVIHAAAMLAQERARNAELVEAGEWLLSRTKALASGASVRDLDEAIRRMELALTPPSTDRGGK